MKVIFIVIICFTLTLPTMAQKKYSEQWQKIDSLQKLGQVQSALSEVMFVYAGSKEEGNDSQMLKALLYKIMLEAEYQEDSFEQALAFATHELESAKSPVKQVLYSIIAQVYLDYYSENRWQISDRTPVAGDPSPDMATWDARRFVEICTEFFLLSVSEPDILKNTPLGQMEGIIVEKRNTRNLRPTLYDFLAFRAVDFFSGEMWSYTEPSNVFRMDSVAFFAPAKDFIEWDIISEDQRSFDFLTLKLYQEILRFHISNKDDVFPLVDADLARLAFVYRKSTYPEKDQIYIRALRQLAEIHKDSPVSADIIWQLALQLRTQGYKYQPLISDAHKWDVKEALEIAENVARQFPDTDAAKNCLVVAGQIKSPSLRLTASSQVVPGLPALTLVDYRNVDSLFLRIVEMDPDAERSFMHRDQKELLEKYLSGNPVQSWTRLLPTDGDYQTHRAEIHLPAMAPGFYVLLASNTSEFSLSSEISYYSFWSTSISVINREKEDGSREIFVLHRNTGLPMSGVKIQALYQKYDYRKRETINVRGPAVISGKDGYAIIPTAGNEQFNEMYLVLSTKKDKFMTEPFYERGYRYDKEPTVEIKTHFFTDRAIYRPGQTIYFKGIVLEKTGDKSEIKPGYSTMVKFRDANGQDMASQPLKTNDFGSFSGSFVAPLGVLSGQMEIYSDNGQVNIQVEEYKRPKFEVTFNPVEGSFKLDGEVAVTGQAMAYAGSILADATVVYRVVRNARFPYFFWGWRDRYPSSPAMEIASGVSVTGSKGEFEIKFNAVSDPSVARTFSPVFTYTIYADVTDINGETHSAQTSVSVGYESVLITTNVEDNLNAADGLLLKVQVKNLNGQPVAAEGTITVDRVILPSTVLFQRKWQRPDRFTMSGDMFKKLFPGEVYDNEDDVTLWARGETVFSAGFSTPGDSAIQVLTHHEAGLYVMEIKTKDDDGKDVEYTKYFNVYDVREDKPATASPLEAILLTPVAEPGETASLLVASPLKKARVMVEIISKNSQPIRNNYNIGNSRQRINIPVLEEHRGNIIINLTMIYQNRVFQQSKVVEVPYTNKELEIITGSFRSELEPGQEEEWHITIRNKEGEGVVAEMLATMYDASLDAFLPHWWPFPLYNELNRVQPWDEDAGFQTVTANINWYQRNFGSIIEKEYEELIWYRRFGNFRGGILPMMASEVMKMEVDQDAMEYAVAESADMSPRSAATADEEPGIPVTRMDDSTGMALPLPVPLPAKPRTNFNETAFFFPQLATNANGETVLKFKMPESLTRWRIMGLAHTRDLKLGTLEKSLVTKKELMVFPNPPRFLREGDRMVFAAKVTNISDGPLSGNAELQFFDAFTMQPIDSLMGLFDSSMSFSVDKDESTTVSWDIHIPGGLHAVVYRITATAGTFSDGEEAALPVLTNRILVTESLPLPVRGNTDKTFNFEKLADSGKKGSTLRNHRLVLEYTSNPAWYAVQALPYLMEYPHDCSEQVFSRWYANTLAGHIANSDPKIKRIFDGWRTLSPDALKSNLEKNEDLKSVLLQETPWVRESDNESERKQRIGLLFDLNRMAQEQTNALKKLREMQTVNGGWPWFPGMPESEYITRHIVTGIGKMIQMGAVSEKDNSQLMEMTGKAIAFLDQEMLKDFEELKKRDPDFLKARHLGNDAIQYLYARSPFLAMFPLSDAVGKMVNYYLSQATSSWIESNNYMKAMTALSLSRFGETKTAALIMRALTETALHSDEMGMYWRNQPRGWFWYEAPVETHALMIEAYDEVLNDKASVEELKIWLLKQKQTRDWKTTRATADAVYALLKRGRSILEPGEPVAIRVGNQQVNTNPVDGTQPEPGSGYFRTSWSAPEITPGMGKIEVSNPNPGISWGAIYWQYFEQLDKITPAQTPLKLLKNLFREVNSPSGPFLEPVDENMTLNVGDKVVVRIVLSSDRDMEFIHLKDMRASAFEPVNVLSGYRWQGGLGYYESTLDAATHFFIDYLPKGTYVLEYKVYATQSGEFSNGISTVQSMYAPEFSAHSEGITVKVE
jgi:hypothetical protein